MATQEQPPEEQYPHGRGYGHDYMRGGEVGDGYGYAAREEYERPRGDLRKGGQTARKKGPDKRD